MGWFKDTFAAEPFECPRGWGQVSFVLEFVMFPVFVDIERKCPIGGVENCSKCRYPLEPGSGEQLRLRLAELDGLRGSTLSEEEFRIRRRLVVEGHDPKGGVPTVPGQDTAIAALVLGPLGVVAIGAGSYFSSFVLGVGLVLSALAASFTGISMIQRRALANPDDPHFEDSRHDTRELEAELGRAREELGFFRELHEGESSGKMRPPDADDS